MTVRLAAVRTGVRTGAIKSIAFAGFPTCAGEEVVSIPMSLSRRIGKIYLLRATVISCIVRNPFYSFLWNKRETVGFSLKASIPAIQNKTNEGIPRKVAEASMTTPHTIKRRPAIFVFFILKAT